MPPILNLLIHDCVAPHVERVDAFFNMTREKGYKIIPKKCLFREASSTGNVTESFELKSGKWFSSFLSKPVSI